MKAKSPLNDPGARVAVAARPRADTAASRTIESAQLLAGAPAVTIAHNGFLYRLQATRAGKLILTK